MALAVDARGEGSQGPRVAEGVNSPDDEVRGLGRVHLVRSGSVIQAPSD